MTRGILSADLLTTSSPSFAREALTHEGGEGLDSLLRERKDRLSGILSGIDTDMFDPSRDAYIAATYDADCLDGKAICKACLQREFCLKLGADIPLIALITPLVDQKGLDLVAAIMPDLLNTDAQLIVLGTGEARYERLFADLHLAHSDRIAIRLVYDTAQAHRAFAGCDMLMMPSRTEPGGTGQLVALRYGTIPIVRATGALNDTVREGTNGNGFRFHHYNASPLFEAVGRALKAFRDQHSWASLQERGMCEDHSWDNSAQLYAELYERGVQLHGALSPTWSM
ncbi:MAG: hypothetical protein NVS4B8_00360 [Herpetosiphon sp.]